MELINRCCPAYRDAKADLRRPEDLERQQEHVGDEIDVMANFFHLDGDEDNGVDDDADGTMNDGHAGGMIEVAEVGPGGVSVALRITCIFVPGWAARSPPEI